MGVPPVRDQLARVAGRTTYSRPVPAAGRAGTGAVEAVVRGVEVGMAGGTSFTRSDGPATGPMSFARGSGPHP